jgi:hypothetical protein
MEIWKTIKRYKDYQVSDLGNVKSFKRCNVIYVKKELSKKGYYRVALFKDGVRKYFSVNRLVAEAFIPNLENKPQVNHINGIKTDDNVKNLEWCTQSENMKHAYKNGLNFANSGSKCNLSKLTEKEVKEIRQIGNSMYRKEVAKIYGVNRLTIGHIVNNKSWK